MSGYKHKTEEFFGTLFHSWGSDTPQEAIWAANDFIAMMNDLFNLGITEEFVIAEDEEDDMANELLIKKILEALLALKAKEAKKK